MKTKIKSMIYATLVSVALIGGFITTVHAMSKTEPTFNDLEIAHIAYTAGAIDIRYAHLALALSDDPEVRKFATLMIQDHTAVNNKALELVKKLQITPQDNAMSQQLTEQAKKVRSELSQLRGGAFAKRYAANELGYHQTVNDVVENVFIPQAQNTELKGLLTAALQTFKVHQGHAETMNKKAM